MTRFTAHQLESVRRDKHEDRIMAVVVARAPNAALPKRWDICLEVARATLTSTSDDEIEAAVTLALLRRSMTETAT